MVRGILEQASHHIVEAQTHCSKAAGGSCMRQSLQPEKVSDHLYKYPPLVGRSRCAGAVALTMYSAMIRSGARIGGRWGGGGGVEVPQIAGPQGRSFLEVHIILNSLKADMFALHNGAASKAQVRQSTGHRFS